MRIMKRMLSLCQSWLHFSITEGLCISAEELQFSMRVHNEAADKMHRQTDCSSMYICCYTAIECNLKIVKCIYPQPVEPVEYL